MDLNQLPVVTENPTNCTQAEIVSEIISFMDIGSLYGAHRESEIASKMLTFSHNSLALIARSAEIRSRHIGITYKFLQSAIMDHDEAEMRELLFLRPHFLIDMNVAEAVEIIRGLHKLVYFRNHGKLDELTGQNLEIAKAFINVTAAILEFTENGENLLRYSNKSVYVVNADLAHVIEFNSDRAMDMFRFISDRYSAHPDALRDYLGNATALGDGTL